MEQWEIDLRARLQKEVSDGIYQIDTGEGICLTGKDGYIEFEVAVAKRIRNNCFALDEKEE